jgi:hypothetical protein
VSSIGLADVIIRCGTVTQTGPLTCLVAKACEGVFVLVRGDCGKMRIMVVVSRTRPRDQGPPGELMLVRVKAASFSKQTSVEKDVENIGPSMI